ncbi:MAG: hypothetical protein R3B09_31815 [Nannocystaceae bacterium]
MGGLCVGLADDGKLDVAIPLPILWGALATGALAIGTRCGSDRRSRGRSSLVCLALVVPLALCTSWYASARASLFLVELALPAIAALLIAAFVGARLDSGNRPRAVSLRRSTPRS